MPIIPSLRYLPLLVTTRRLGYHGPLIRYLPRPTTISSSLPRPTTTSSLPSPTNCCHSSPTNYHNFSPYPNRLPQVLSLPRPTNASSRPSPTDYRKFSPFPDKSSTADCDGLKQKCPAGSTRRLPRSPLFPNDYHTCVIPADRCSLPHTLEFDFCCMLSWTNGWIVRLKE